MNYAFWREDYRNRPRHHQLRRCRDGGEGSQGYPNAEGNRLTPSVARVYRQGRKPSWASRPGRQAVTNPTRTVSSIKRFMGRRHNEVGSEEKIVPYKVVGGSEDYVKVHVDGHDTRPRRFPAFTLRKLEKRRGLFGHKVTRP